jgi:dihydrofolate reductase
MFGRKKTTPQIDQEQLELIKNAQKRIKQKKGLYTHFILFLIGSIFLIIANTVLGIGEDIMLFGVQWFVPIIILWLVLLTYHFIKVYVTNRFMGKDWEKKQLEKLVAKQRSHIDKIKAGLEKEAKKIAESEFHNEQKTLKDGGSRAFDLTLIAAVGEDNSIGKDNDLIWHLSDDLRRFKSLTNGHHLIMGRKTFESFPKPLPNRTHIVVTRNKNYKAPDGVKVADSIEAAIAMVENDEQPFIIGGGEIYKQAMPLVKKIELTRVHETFPEADTFFPKIESSEWKEVQRLTHDADDKHKYPFSFITYERR